MTNLGRTRGSYHWEVGVFAQVTQVRIKQFRCLQKNQLYPIWSITTFFLPKFFEHFKFVSLTNNFPMSPLLKALLKGNANKNSPDSATERRRKNTICHQKTALLPGYSFCKRVASREKLCKNLPKGKASEDCWWFLFLGSEKKKLCSKRCLLLTQYLQLHKIFQLVCRRWLFVEISLWILKHRNFHPHVFFFV